MDQFAAVAFLREAAVFFHRLAANTEENSEAFAMTQNGENCTAVANLVDGLGDQVRNAGVIQTDLHRDLTAATAQAEQDAARINNLIAEVAGERDKNTTQAATIHDLRRENARLQAIIDGEAPQIVDTPPAVA